MSEAARLLGPGGPLAQRLPGYEAREGQLEMARQVESALGVGRVLLCEAGTGTGKTLAYLVPAILSGAKVVISTATRALQEQIMREDLPLIERTLGLKPSVALMKGLGNYLCRRRFEERLVQPSRSAEQARTLQRIRDWQRQTEVGDIGEVDDLAENEALWGEITASSDTRLGNRCSHYERCYVTRMRRAAEEARIVIVNHHLFFADLALRGPHPGRVLPAYDAVIFDEAHQLEDIATDFFGVRISTQRIERLARDVERALDSLIGVDAALVESSVDSLFLELRRATTLYFTAMDQAAEGRDGRRELSREALLGEPHEAWLRLDTALEALSAVAEATVGRIPRLRAVGSGVSLSALSETLEVGQRRADELREALRTIAEPKAEHVLAVERSERGVTVSAAPIDLSSLLRARVFESVSAAVLTSATLTSDSGRASPSRAFVSASEPPPDSQRLVAAGSELAANPRSGPFGFLRTRLGLHDLVSEVVELTVPSPFDYAERALLYTPRDLPSPNQPDFVQQAAARIEQLIRITGGGAFVLTTSLRSMRLLYAELGQRLPTFPLLVQGSAPKPQLLERFRRDGNAVLVATSSFWEGVDVPGHALRLVVLEKIPFAVPTDPLVRARSAALEARGLNPFIHYSVPAAAIALKQGFGRLIRSRTDAGIVALLDERLHRKGYGRQLLSSLPPAGRTDELARVQRFWDKLAPSLLASREK